MNTVILAGGSWVNEEEPSKALVKLKNRPMIHYVIDALKAADEVDKIMVIGNVDSLKPLIAHQVDLLVQDRGSIIDNVLEAVKYFIEDEHLLIATADIPLLKATNVSGFLKAALRQPVDIFYPIVEKGLCEGMYPDLKRTYVTLKEGTFTGGNLFVVSPGAIEKIEKMARAVVRHRKDPLKMCKLLGIRFVFKLLMKRLSLCELEAYLYNKFHLRGKAYISHSPEICHDLDHPEDKIKIENYLV